MTKFSITTILLLLLTRFTVATDAVNPISKFLMMGNSNSRSHGGARGEEGVDDAELLVHAKQLVEQVQAAEASRDQALKDQQAASAALATLQIDMEDLRKDTGVRIEQLSQSSDAAQQVVQVQEQAAKRMEEVKVRYERELAEANELSAKREGELKAQYERELSEATDAIAGATDAIAETEAELKDQHRRALMEARDVSAQREAELKNTIEQKESEMASATAIDTEFAEANVELVKKNEELTARIQELDALQKDGSQRIDEGKEEVRVQLQQEIDEMTAKNSKYIEKLGGQLSAVKQERNNLQKLNADQDEKASQMQEESRQALNAALAEHEKEVEELQGKVATAIDARKQLEKEKKDQTRALATLENKLVEAKKVSSSFR
jgi:chromosome segregation ATPase